MARIDKILIANRGEIARRIMRTCRDMGISTVAVFSDADADALHVHDADEAVHIGPAPSAESYLVIDNIIAAAKRTNADAIHPGYGFLAENAEFAQKVDEAGIIFIGPSADAIRQMGSKQRAKRLAAEAGVPTIPGYNGDEQDTATLIAKIEEVGYPALVKASAGGGGKGMRIVRSSEDAKDAIERARSEAKSSFGDETLLIERYIENPRHVEVQILGDTHGNLVHLFERECSIQRRHQKIIEESPSPGIDEETRQKMCSAAVSLGKSIGYSNAGTVELIVAPDGAFYFLEVNTRLQVEHPVTECITGIDLVREQIRVAEGEKLSFSQEDLRSDGWAVEVRLYAEDPDNDFLPASGPVLDFDIPSGVRVDTGVEAGGEIGIHYDPMLAKIIAHAPTRGEACKKLARALELGTISGLTTNRGLLVDILRNEEFLSGAIDTHFLDRNLGALAAAKDEQADVLVAAIAVTLAQFKLREAERTLASVPMGFRNNRYMDQVVEQQIGEDFVRVEYRVSRDGIVVQAKLASDDDGEPREGKVTRLTLDEGVLQFELDGRRRTGRIVFAGERFFGRVVGHHFSGRTVPRFSIGDAEDAAGGCVAPMPGKVLALHVEVGQDVKKGDAVAVLEAMKMEHSVVAPFDGVVTSVPVAVGAQVEDGALLVVVEEKEDE